MRQVINRSERGREATTGAEVRARAERSEDFALKPRWEAVIGRPPLASAAEPPRPDDAELVRALRARRVGGAGPVEQPRVQGVPRGDAHARIQRRRRGHHPRGARCGSSPRIHRIDDPGALGSFVFSVALRIVKWELRRRRVRRILHLTDTGVLPEQRVEPADSEGREAWEGSTPSSISWAPKSERRSCFATWRR